MHRHKTGNVRTAAFLFTFCLVIFTLYYNFHENNIYRIDYTNFDIGKERREINDSEDYLINTRGCYIPNYGKKLVFNEYKIINKNCGRRAIFIGKTENDNEVEFRIDSKILNTYYNNDKKTCFYNFGMRSTIAGLESKKLSYTEWKPFQNGTKITLLNEIITVMCNTTSSKKGGNTAYEDAYVFIKKLDTNTTKSGGKAWNVLIVGLDTMSRQRLVSSMPGTYQYLKKNGWLDYKGYNKVGYNTFPNLMAFLSGKKMETVISRCSQSLYDCNDIFIWSRFREAGYITAYGEDNLRLPDTFARYNGFRLNPTDHYIRPFFLTGEALTGNYMCAHHKPSAIHILNYAYDFVDSYKNDKFLGIFWINSFSHNLEYNPKLYDRDMIKFFERLNENQALNNTIVIFTSDHGIRYGDMRLPIEFYYEERLPMMFVWIPHELRRLFEQKYNNLQLNQNRLVTPYDIYITLAEISNNFEPSLDIQSEACSKCTSIFNEKPSERTCADGGIDALWCTCHNITKVDAKDNAAKTSLHRAVKYIQDRAKTVQTKNSRPCRSTRIGKVLRTHSYTGSGNKTYYVVAWLMAPGGMTYEATVEKDLLNYTVLEPVHTIAAYAHSKHGYCVVHQNDREYCVC